MDFNKSRMAKLAGLLKEGVEPEDAKTETHVEESDDGMYEVDEKTIGELEESFDLRKAIRDEIKRSLDARDDSVVRYTSGQVFGGNRVKNYGGVTMGFPGIGVRR